MRWIRIFLPFILVTLLLSSLFLKKSLADVTASLTVPPRTSDFQFSFQGDTADDVPQGTTIHYTITYGAYASAGVSTTKTIVVNFSDDKDTNATDVLNYVLGSASNGYNNTSPVIDVTNRTITWTITNFPAGVTDQTLTFSLQTNANSTGNTSVPFSVKATMSNQYITLPQQQVNGSYLFNGGLVPTSTPTPGPTNTPAPGPTATPTPAGAAQPTQATTPTPTPIPTSINNLTLQSVDITNISDNSVQVRVTASNPSHVTILYGNDSTHLSKTITSPTFSSISSLTLDKVQAKTIYYFRIHLTDASGQTYTSDLFTVTTAETSTPPSTNQTSLVLLSQGTVLVTASAGQQQLTGIVLPIHQPLTVALALPSFVKTPLLQAVMRPKVLGITSAHAAETVQTITVPLIEQSPGQYVAHFITPETPGIYTISVRIGDSSGNIVEKPLADIHAALPLRVVEEKINQPIVHARIFLSAYNRKMHTFYAASDLIASVKNPSFTDSNGIFAVALPKGIYKVTVSAFGYKTKTIIFTLGDTFTQTYPVITLSKQALSPMSLGSFLFTDAQDTMHAGINALQQLVASYHFTQTNQLLTLVLLIILTILSFFARTFIPMKQLVHFLHFHATQQSYIHGIVIDKTQKPIAQATIILTDMTTKQIVARATTDASGMFYCNVLDNTSYIITAVKEGFRMETTLLISNKPLVLLLHTTTEKSQSLKKFFVSFCIQLLGMFFETLVVLSFFGELLLFNTFGMSIFFFFALSCLNVLLWLLFLRQHHMRKILLS